MTDNPSFWRSIHGDGPYEVSPLTPRWVLGVAPREQTRLGIFASELEAVERAIRDNQRLARTIKAQIATLKERRAALKAGGSDD